MSPAFPKSVTHIHETRCDSRILVTEIFEPKIQIAPTSSKMFIVTLSPKLLSQTSRKHRAWSDFDFENSDFRFKINNFERKWFEFIFILIYFNLHALLTKLTLKGVQGLSSPENVSFFSIELISLISKLKVQKFENF